jgi:hypothetical protein
VVLADPAAPIDQQPHHLELLVMYDGVQALHADPTSAMEYASVSSVLRPCPVAYTPHPRRQFGGHVDHRFLARTEPLGDVPADPLTPLDRPRPGRPEANIREHLGEAASSVVNRPRPTIPSSGVMTSTVTVRLCGSMSIAG